eukprot:m.187536 g.187536  ORF g.187536 m.187536 type:complete len:186 (-) comp15071_c0_seq3:978-1535(-)
MPVECPGCKKEKLARDFLPGPPSVSCDHGPSTCFSCMATHFAKHSTCPECEKEVTESEIAQIKQGLKIVADPMSFRLPRAVSLGGEIVIATLEGHVYHMNAEADTPVADIKIFLEGVAGVGRRQQRLMYNNREVKVRHDCVNCSIKLILATHGAHCRRTYAERTALSRQPRRFKTMESLWGHGFI